MTEKELQLVQLTNMLNNPWLALTFAVLAVWTIVWKGTALWKAARNNQMIWFVVMLFVNTVGILEIIYIFYFSKKKDKPVV